MSISDPAKTRHPSTAVFVPCYNHAAYVEQTLRSILRQTLVPDELLVIDDGSTDGSAEVIAAVLKDCSFPCEMISRPNRGLSATLNEGFKRTRGKYFAYLGSDDLWLPDFLKERVSLLERRPDAVLAHGNAYTIDGDSRIFETSADWNTYIDDNARPLLDRALAPISSTVCHRRAVLEKFSWNEDSRLEDFELYLYLSYEGVFAFDPRVFSAWRMHASNTSRDTAWMFDECLAAHGRVAERLALPESQLKNAIAKTSLEYSLLFARRGHTARAISLLLRNWIKAPDLVKPIKVLGHCLLPAPLKRMREQRQKHSAGKRFR